MPKAAAIHPPGCRQAASHTSASSETASQTNLSPTLTWQHDDTTLCCGLSWLTVSAGGNVNFRLRGKAELVLLADFLEEHFADQITAVVHNCGALIGRQHASFTTRRGTDLVEVKIGRKQHSIEWSALSELRVWLGYLLQKPTSAQIDKHSCHPAVCRIGDVINLALVAADQTTVLAIDFDLAGACRLQAALLQAADETSHNEPHTVAGLGKSCLVKVSPGDSQSWASLSIISWQENRSANLSQVCLVLLAIEINTLLT